MLARPRETPLDSAAERACHTECALSCNAGKRRQVATQLRCPSHEQRAGAAVLRLSRTFMKPLRDIEPVSETSGIHLSRRGEPRVPVTMDVSVNYQAERFEGTVVNIGVGGAFIEAAPRLSYGTLIEISVRLPGLQQPSLVPAVVRWSSEVGFGVQFQALGARETHAISGLVSASKRG
jgi:hypothetical protein